MKVYKGKVFSVTMPSVWEGEYDEDDHYDVLYNPDGPGELQFSSISYEKKLSINDLMHIAEEDIQAGARLEEIELGDFKGITFEYDIENEYWCEWYLASDNVLLFVTYSCLLDKEGRDADDVELIMGTLTKQNDD